LSASRRRILRQAARLALTTALGTLALGYGRRVYAGGCNPVSGVFLCTGPADVYNDVSQLIAGTNVVVSTAPDFGISLLGGSDPALVINAQNGLLFDGSAEGLILSGAEGGLKATNATSGSITVDTRGGRVSGDLLGQPAVGHAIWLVNGSGTADVSLMTGNVRSYVPSDRTRTAYGILVDNQGAGRTSIDTTAGFLSSPATALKATALGNGLSIRAGNVVGGIVAQNAGTGSVIVDTAAGSVNATSISGIAVTNQASGGAVTVTTGSVGGTRGVSIRNDGSGPTAVDTTRGSVSGLADAQGRGVSILQAATAGAVTVSTADVTGSGQGVYVKSASAAPVAIDTRAGTVRGVAGNGIIVLEGRSTSISTATVYGGVEGVAANNKAGAIAIDTTGGSVTGYGQNGINVYNYGTGISVATKDVTGAANGIFLNNKGTGTLIVDTTAGSVTGNGGDGINAVNRGTDVTVAAGSVSGTRYGISAVNLNAGDLYISTDGTIFGQEAAIAALNNGRNTSVHLQGNVSGQVLLNHFGTGRMAVDTRNAAIDSHVSGVEVVANSAADVSILTGAITGYSMEQRAGVVARQFGQGKLTIDTRHGLIMQQGSYGGGIDALTLGSELTITAGDLNTIGAAIWALNNGSGPARIDTSEGFVKSSIYAANQIRATDLLITTGPRVTDVTARNFGSGRVVIDTRGGLVDSIDVFNAGSDVMVTAGNIGSPVDAIKVENLGSGASAVSVTSGSLAAGASSAVNLIHRGLGAFRLDNAGTLANSSGFSTALAVKAEARGTAPGITVRNTGAITGIVELTAKDDSFINDGTWNMASGASDFGAGSDVFDNRSNLTFVAAVDPDQAETTTLNNLESFRNSGAITLRDGAVGDVLITSGNFDGTGGTISLDMMADGSGGDLVRILGSVTGGATRLSINRLGTGGVPGAGSVPLIDVEGHTTEGDFRIANPVWEGLVYKMVLDSAHRWGVAAAFSLADTLAGLARDAQVAGRLLNGQQAGLINAMAQDCTRFGASGACLSLGGRGTSTNGDAGSSQALVLTAAVKPAGSDWRMGAFLDQRLAGELPDGLSFESMGPVLGGFAGYGAASGHGPRFRVSGAWSTAQLGIQRPALAGLIEGGEAEASFYGGGFGGEAGYGFGVGDTATLTPFLGLRRVVSTRGGYSEQGGDAAYPLIAQAMSLEQTTLTGGLALQAGLGDSLSLSASFGVEHDIFHGLDGFSGEIQDVSSFSIAADEPWRETRIFGGAGLDFGMADGIGLSLSASARQLPLDGATDVTATAAVRVSF